MVKEYCERECLGMRHREVGVEVGGGVVNGWVRGKE